ncbi:F0F1 ATP synthase subunit epsilon [Subtercola endophyticus]|uniref:F0F1 ATP synthase subunit epsilon n=1 Tax=Subtercola endophyticus TaxID=2895559 RepID=UPI001E313095|nr:F0F1 ATP synthase subunit epsilon [Subtercola endophyticus]UFS60054.1 F0F1 ATP synthase subunit epsilon [Subtercola endophyticus]
MADVSDSAPLQVSVVAADHEVWSGGARQVIAKTSEGEIGILRGHEPLLAILAEGEVRVTLVDGQRIVAQADEGFLSVENDRVTIVARAAELVS